MFCFSLFFNMNIYKTQIAEERRAKKEQKKNKKRTSFYKITADS